MKPKNDLIAAVFRATVELAYLRSRGVPAERVLGVLARWSGLTRGEPVNARGLVDTFSVERLSREPVRVDRSELEGALGL